VSEMKAVALGFVAFTVLFGASVAQNSNPALAGEEFYRECKYFVVTVTNWGDNQVSFVGASTRGGKIEAIPPAGVKIGKSETARLVFVQNNFPTFSGPDVTMEFTGQKGHFFLKAQQNYCLLEAGDIQCSADYKGTGEVKQNVCTSIRGAYGQSNGKVSFAILEA